MSFVRAFTDLTPTPIDEKDLQSFLTDDSVKSRLKNIILSPRMI